MHPLCCCVNPPAAPHGPNCFPQCSVDRREAPLITVASWRWAMSSWRSTVFPWGVGSTRMQRGSLQKPLRPKRRTTLTSWWLIQGPGLVRVDFTGGRSLYDINTVCGQVGLIPRPKISWRFAGWTLQRFAQWKTKKGYSRNTFWDLLSICINCCLHFLVFPFELKNQEVS